jgi:membrane-associated phospholipid phosphatase
MPKTATMPPRARLGLVGAAVGVGLLIVTWYAAYHVGVINHADQSILGGFEDLQRPRLNRITSFIARLCNPHEFVCLAAVPVLVALARRRPQVAAALVVILLGANETTQLLKPLLAAPRGASLLPLAAPGNAAWPSGHATAAMSLALCAVIAAPARLRPFVAALGAAFAVAVCFSFLELGWHYPSDVLGGFLVATTWTLLGIAAVELAEARWPRRTSVANRELAAPQSLREALGPPAAVLLGALVLGGLLVLARPHAVVAYARAHEAFLVGAATIGAVGLALSTGMMLALRRYPHK